MDYALGENMTKSTNDSQLKANRKDYEKNKEARKKAAYRRQARLFIKSHSDISDLKELKDLIKQREEQLKKDPHLN